MRTAHCTSDAATLTLTKHALHSTRIAPPSQRTKGFAEAYYRGGVAYELEHRLAELYRARAEDFDNRLYITGHSYVISAWRCWTDDSTPPFCSMFCMRCPPLPRLRFDLAFPHLSRT